MTKMTTGSGNPGFAEMTSVPLGPEHVFNLCRPIVEGLTEYNVKILTNCLEFNREWTGFLMHRLQQDMAHVHDLTKCTQPREVFEVHSTFVTEAVADYQREFAQLATLNGKGFEQTTRALQGSLDTMAPAKAAAE